MKLKYLLYVMLVYNIILSQSDPSLSITIGSATHSGTGTAVDYPTVTLNNSVMTLRIRPQTGGQVGTEHVIKNWTVKSINTDIVNGKYVDGCAQRGPADTAYVTDNSTDKKTVRLIYRYTWGSTEYEGISDYTIYANSPVVKITYEKYEYLNGWANAVDYLDYSAITQDPLFKIYGDTDYGPFEYYPGSYWDTKDSGDVATGGALNYGDHFIMTLSNSGTGLGFGRVMPVYAAYGNKGIKIMKLISQSDKGYEIYPATGGINHPAFNGFIYFFTGGSANGIAMGQEIIDNELAGQDPPLPVELNNFSVRSVSNSALIEWSTSSELDNYGFEIERKMEGEFKWITAGFVEGKGNSNLTNSYAFKDDQLSSGIYFYRLKQIDNSGNIKYSKTVQITMNFADNFELFQNYPNPFNPETTIKFQIPAASEVTLEVFNMLGQKVAKLLNEKMESGIHKITFNASAIEGGLSSGIYIYKLTSGKYISVKKLMLIK